MKIQINLCNVHWHSWCLLPVFQFDFCVYFYSYVATKATGYWIKWTNTSNGILYNNILHVVAHVLLIRLFFVITYENQWKDVYQAVLRLISDKHLKTWPASASLAVYFSRNRSGLYLCQSIASCSSFNHQHKSCFISIVLNSEIRKLHLY